MSQNYGNVASATLINPDGTPFPPPPNNAPSCNGAEGKGKGDYTVCVCVCVCVYECVCACVFL